MDKNDIKEIIMSERAAAKDDIFPILATFAAGLLGGLIGSGFMAKKQKRKQKKQNEVLCVSVLQYDKEVAMYQELWEKLCECTASVKSLVPIFSVTPENQGDQKKADPAAYTKACKDYNQFAACIEKSSPFCKDEYYIKLIQIRNCCIKIINLSYIDTLESQIKNQELSEKKEAIDTIDKLQNELRDDIKNHIQNLEVVQQ